MKKWIRDIREKTADMNREQKLQYIAGYYWYHILLGFLFAGIVILFIYHVVWGDRSREFTCVIINQAVDYERDRKLEEQFAAASGMKEEELLIDSDYQISYGGRQFQDVKESSYEKFFFNWQAKEIDAMVMPESFYEFCLKQGGVFSEEKIPVGMTRLGDTLSEEENDPVYLVFAADTKHEKACRRFQEFLCDGVVK